LLRFFGAPDVSRIDSAAFLGLRNRQERLPWGPLEVRKRVTKHIWF